MIKKNILKVAFDISSAVLHAAMCVLLHLNEHDVSVVGAPVVEGVGDQSVGFSVLLGTLKGIYNVVACHYHHVLRSERKRHFHFTSHLSTKPVRKTERVEKISTGVLSTS